MDGETLQRLAIERADELPGTGLEFPFGPEWQVYKVRGKVFMLMTQLRGEAIVTLKADPEDAIALQDQYQDITAGYHMNKKHWITLYPSGQLSTALISALVTQSYLLVVAKLPRANRPVNPHTFGRETSA